MAGPGRPKKIHDNQESNEFTRGVTLETPVPDFSKVEEVSEYAVGIDPAYEEPTAALYPITEIGPQEVNTLHNWLPIDTAPRNGFPIKLSDDVSNPGITGFWRKSRAFANPTHRWETTGFWTDSATGRNVEFTPIWWKDRNAL